MSDSLTKKSRLPVRGVRGGLAALLLLAALCGWVLPPGPAAEVAQRGAVHVVTVQQAITPATTSYIRRALERAALSRAECLIIQLDTPGGLLDSTREIVQALLNAPLPVVVYIAPAGARGASAGTMITLASHVAAMAPATHIGAAHPVSLFGGQDNKVMADKILNDTSPSPNCAGATWNGPSPPCGSPHPSRRRRRSSCVWWS
jgi:membrane-bound serine protease (ClpP class)